MEQVWVMEWGEPRIKNVIDVDYVKNEVKLQSPGHFGSYWTPFSRCMSDLAVAWFYIQEAAAEVDRLQIKRIIMESKELIKSATELKS